MSENLVKSEYEGELCEPGYQFLEPDNARGWRSVMSMPLGEMIETGLIDFSKPEWDFDYFDREQRDRLYQKLTRRYYFRDIGVLPPARWRMRLIGSLNELMDKYKWAYQALKDGIDPLQASNRYRRYVNIDSDFPQTLLSKNQDYASYGTDFEEEETIQNDFLDFLLRLRRAKGVDEALLDELEPLFSSLITVNINGY